MFILRQLNSVPLAFVGCLLLVLPSCLAADDDGGNAESQDSTEPRLVRRNFLRFGKRSDPSTDNVSWMKRESENGPGEIFESTLVGVHPHRSSPRSFLRFGKRSSSSLLRPESEKQIFSSKSDFDESFDDIPYSAEELEEMLMRKRADNFLRFGKRYLPKDLKDRLRLMTLSDDGMNKRSKDFLRFG